MRTFLYAPLIIGIIVMIVGLLTFKRTEEKELSQNLTESKVFMTGLVISIIGAIVAVLNLLIK